MNDRQLTLPYNKAIKNEKTGQNNNPTKNKNAFNSTNENIDWAKWSWNPITGCEHGCEYCYAKSIATRFLQTFPKGFEPDFHEDRLSAPFNTRMPQGLEKDPGGRNVFCVSMGDMFGDWVPVHWINRILDVIQKSPQWNYIILTKNPARLPEFSPYPDNTWIGSTVDRQARVAPTEEAFKNVIARVRFVSCEPILEGIKFNNMELFNWIIIGGLRRGCRFHPSPGSGHSLKRG